MIALSLQMIKILPQEVSSSGRPIARHSKRCQRGIGNAGVTPSPVYAPIVFAP